MITIVDYGMGNLGSVRNMLNRIGAESQISGDPEIIDKATKVLLPGVGAFDAAMEKIVSSGLKDVLDKKALQDKVPVLGICLGMQLLTRGSEEGTVPGLGWVDADTIKFPTEVINSLKIPHMGWNVIVPRKASRLIVDLPREPRFYFVHSYRVECNNPEDVLCTTPFGVDFHSVIQHGNIFGAQFHPEKSHKFGMKLLENFAKIDA